MTFAQRRNRLTTHFSERVPVVKRRISVLSPPCQYSHCALHSNGLIWCGFCGLDTSSNVLSLILEISYGPVCHYPEDETKCYEYPKFPNSRPAKLPCRRQETKIWKWYIVGQFRWTGSDSHPMADFIKQLAGFDSVTWHCAVPVGRRFDSRWLSLEFFIDIILPVTLWPCGRLSL
jgi:hypothetical protein